MSTISALTGLVVLTGTAGVKVLTEAAPEDLLSNGGFESPVIETGKSGPGSSSGLADFHRRYWRLILLAV